MASNQSLVWSIAKAAQLFQVALTCFHQNVPFSKKQSSDHTIDQQFYIRNSASDQVDWMVTQQLQQLDFRNRSRGDWDKRPATNTTINQFMLASDQMQQMVLKA